MLDSMKCVSVCVPMSHLVTGGLMSCSRPPYGKGKNGSITLPSYPTHTLSYKLASHFDDMLYYAIHTHVHVDVLEGFLLL